MSVATTTARSRGTLRYAAPLTKAVAARRISPQEKLILSSIADMFSQEREWAFIPLQELHRRTGFAESTIKLRLPRLFDTGILKVIGAWMPNGRGWGDVVSVEYLKPRPGKKQCGVSRVVVIDLEALEAAPELPRRSAPKRGEAAEDRLVEGAELRLPEVADSRLVEAAEDRLGDGAELRLPEVADSRLWEAAEDRLRSASGIRLWDPPLGSASPDAPSRACVRESETAHNVTLENTDPDIVTMARELAEEGSPIGKNVVDRIASGRKPTPAQRESIQQIFAQRKSTGHGAIKPTPSGLLVQAYADGQTSASGSKYPAIENRSSDLTALAIAVTTYGGFESVADANKADIASWIRRESEAYRKAQPDGQYQDGYRPAKFLAWLKAGRPNANQSGTSAPVPPELKGLYAQY